MLQFQSVLAIMVLHAETCYVAFLPNSSKPIKHHSLISFTWKKTMQKLKEIHSETEKTKQVVETWPSFMRSNSFIVIKHYNTVYIHKKTL